MNDVTKELPEALKEISQALARQCFGECRGFSDRLLPPNEALPLAKAAIARAEAALAEPQPDADGWIPWAGGECPLAGIYGIVEVRFRDGYTEYGHPSRWNASWIHRPYDPMCDIIAYRIVCK